MCDYCEIFDETDVFEITIVPERVFDPNRGVNVVVDDCFKFNCNCSKSKAKYGWGLKNDGFMWSDTWEEENNDVDKFSICGHLFTAILFFEEGRYSFNTSIRIIINDNMILNKKNIIKNRLYYPFYCENEERLYNNFVIINTKMPLIKHDQLYSYGRIIFKDYLSKKKHNVTLYDGIWSCDCKNENCKQIIKGMKREKSLRNKRELGISLAIKAIS
jgi:hypothetical protein